MPQPSGKEKSISDCLRSVIRNLEWARDVDIERKRRGEPRIDASQAYEAALFALRGNRELWLAIYLAESSEETSEEAVKK
jgi:hypothetical protein